MDARFNPLRYTVTGDAGTLRLVWAVCGVFTLDFSHRTISLGLSCGHEPFLHMAVLLPIMAIPTEFAALKSGLAWLQTWREQRSD